MIQKSTVGPPAQGIPGLPAKEAGQKPREDSSGSFAKTLAGKEKPREPIATPKQREEIHRAKPEKNESDEPPRNDAELKHGNEQQAPPGRKKDLTARETAIANFMDSFESEFEIPPTEMVEAMAHLEPKELTQSPEATAEKVVASLGLSEADQEKAQAMYASLLMNLRQIDQAKPAAAMDTSSAAKSTDRLALAGEQKAKINDALEQLTQKFWETKMAKTGDTQAKGAASRLSAMKELAGLPQGQDLSKLSIDEESFDGGDADFEGADLAGADLSEMRASDLSDRFEAKAVSARIEEGSESNEAVSVDPSKENGKGTRGEARTADGSTRHASSAHAVHAFTKADAEKPIANNVRSKANIADNETDDSDLNVTAPIVPRAGQEASGQGKASQDFLGQSNGSHAGKAGEKTAKESSVSAGSFKAALGSTTPQPLKLEDVAAALKNNAMPGAATVPANVSPKDHEANVQQINSQAQILIKKGGGEMKVQMSPEGMGQIEMKLALKDGKVQLQMATETPEAKKLIESSVADLRSSLAAHKLSVEHVKVDVVAAARTDTQARNETNMNQGQERQGTRQFWNQFQENFGNRQAREGLWDMPDMKAYRQAVRPNPLQPLDVKQPSAARATVSGTGRGLNLVA